MSRLGAAGRCRPSPSHDASLVSIYEDGSGQAAEVSLCLENSLPKVRVVSR
jgi:hypothetical protein